jgi:hypothetical protein
LNLLSNGGFKLYYQAKVVGLDPQIEEAVLIEINGSRVLTFANIMPFKVHIGKEYKVHLELTILDEFLINKVNYEKKNIKQIDNSFNHSICGLIDIDKAIIDAGIILEIDKEFLFDYGYLHEQYVQLLVDRVAIEFIS